METTNKCLLAKIMRKNWRSVGSLRIEINSRRLTAFICCPRPPLLHASFISHRRTRPPSIPTAFCLINLHLPFVPLPIIWNRQGDDLIQFSAQQSKFRLCLDLSPEFRKMDSEDRRPLSAHQLRSPMFGKKMTSLYRQQFGKFK